MIAQRGLGMAAAGILIGFLPFGAVAQTDHSDHSGHQAEAAAPAAQEPEKPQMDHSAHEMPEVDHSAHEMQGVDHSAHEMQGMDHSAHEMQGMDHSAHAMHGMAPADAGDVGNDPPPPPATDHPADKYFPQDRMDAARRSLSHIGEYSTSVLSLDMLEYRPRSGSDGYAWSGEFWTGGDYDRFVLSSEGEGAFGEAPEQVEVQAKWRHALDPFFNLELGVRQDFRPDPERTYAVVGVDGHTPYWIDAEAHLFISNKGDVHARLEASHDWRFTQKVILQPAVEVNFAFQDVPELGIGSGFETIEAGARLRYEFTPKFAPYLGVHWEQKLGQSADLARLEGEGASSVAAVLGIRAWF